MRVGAAGERMRVPGRECVARKRASSAKRGGCRAGARTEGPKWAREELGWSGRGRCRLFSERGKGPDEREGRPSGGWRRVAGGGCSPCTLAWAGIGWSERESCVREREGEVECEKVEKRASGLGESPNQPAQHPRLATRELLQQIGHAQSQRRRCCSTPETQQLRKETFSLLFRMRGTHVIRSG